MSDCCAAQPAVADRPSFRFATLRLLNGKTVGLTTVKQCLKVALVAIVMVGCSGGKKEHAPNLLKARDYAVLEPLSGWIGGKYDYLLLVDEPLKQASFTQYGDRFQDPLNRLQELFPDAPEKLLTDYLAEQEGEYFLQTPSSNPILGMVKNDLIKREFEEAGGLPHPFWELFRKNRPQCAGLIRTSRVEYSAEHSQALVYVEWGCGSLCGSGNIIWLSYMEGEWSIILRKMIFVA